MLAGGILLIPTGIGIGGPGILFFFAGLLLIPLGLIGLFGLMAIAPNDSRVLLLFGEYRGTVTESGFFWVNPFFSKNRRCLP